MKAKSSGENNVIFYGWVIAGSFALLNGIAWGTTQGSFGVFINPLTEDMGWSRTALSAAYSTLVTITFVMGVLWGWLSERWSVRGVIIICGTLIGLGFFLAGTTAHTLWQLYLFFSVIVGIGLGGIIPPMAGLSARWFDRKRGLAIGIGFAGVGLSVIVLPPLAEHIISINGWRNGFQVFGMVAWGATLFGAILVREPRIPAELENCPAAANNPRSQRVGSDRPSPGEGALRSPARGSGVPVSTAVRARSFWLLSGIFVVATLLIQVIFVHLVPRAIDGGITSSTAATLLPVLGVVSIVGKVGGGAFGDRLGPRRVLIAALVLQALSLVWLTAASKLWMFYLFAAVSGLSYGGLAPQPIAMAARIFGPRHIGAIFGALSLGAATGALVGPTMAGYVFDSTGSYSIAFNVSAGIAIVGAILAFLVRERPQERR